MEVKEIKSAYSIYTNQEYLYKRIEKLEQTVGLLSIGMVGLLLIVIYLIMNS